MKKLLLSTFFFLFSVLSWSQTWVYHAFPTDSATWTIAKGTYNVITPTWVEYFQDSSDHYTMSVLDTVIGSQTYSQMALNGSYRCAVRDDGGKIWVVPADSINELLAYDFTIIPGDTVKIWEAVAGSWPLQQFTYFAGYIDSVSINGSYRKRFHFSGSSEWIEGIGSVAGLFYEGWPNVSNFWHNLYCMSHKDNTLYPTASAGTCPLFTVIIYNSIDETTGVDAKFFPNPVSDKLRIESSEALGWVEIYDVLGRITFSVFEKGKLLDLDVSNFPAGIYSISVMDQKGIPVNRKFIKR